jgi:DNA-binding transcriptional MerR regulator
MNIKEISNQSGLPYSTARKYLVLLEESGLLSSRLEDGSRVFDNQSVRYVKRLASMSKDGIPLNEAIDRIRESPYAVSDNSEVAGLQDQIYKLTKEVQSLSDLLQVELSRQKALPERSGPGFWFYIKAAFSSLWSGLRKKNTPKVQ